MLKERITKGITHFRKKISEGNFNRADQSYLIVFFELLEKYMRGELDEEKDIVKTAEEIFNEEGGDTPS